MKTFPLYDNRSFSVGFADCLAVDDDASAVGTFRVKAFGASRAPSVQCDKGLESYIAQMDYISAKVNNILPICGSFSDGKEKELLDIIASLKDEAKGLKGTVKELRNLVKDTESKIAEIKNIFGEGDDIKAIIGDIEDAVYWTSLYADRMATR